MQVRGKPVWLSRHTYEGMFAERPPVQSSDVERVLEDPHHDDGTKAQRWIRNRTILVYYAEDAEGIEVLGVSATRRRLAAALPKPRAALADG